MTDRADPTTARPERPLTRHGTGLAVVGVLALTLVLLGPLFLDRFTLNILTRSMIYAMMAITVDLLWGYTGILTFGQSAFLARAPMRLHWS